MSIYTSFWQRILKRVIDTINPAKASESEIKVPELTEIGERPSSGFSGRLFTWTGLVETRTNSAVFKSLEEVIESNNQFKNKVPGSLQLRVYGNTVLKVKYQPVSFDLLIRRYKEIPTERKEKENKWRLISKFQNSWSAY